MGSTSRFFILLTIVVIPVIISFIGLAIFNKPQTNGTLYLARENMKEKIVIYRDEHGIAHVRANSFTESFYGMGFVHAQDRLWNMHVKRMLFSGRISELFGGQTLIIDKYVRTLGIRKAAEESLEYMHPELREFLQSYVDGINDHISTLKILPLEFLITFNGYNKLEPWTITDVMTFLKFLNFGLTFDWSYELLRSDLIDIIGAELVEQVIPLKYEHMLAKSVILNDEDLKQSDLYKKFETQGFKRPHGNPDAKLQHEPAKTPIGDALFDMVNALGWGKGSNNWAISGEHTESGKPLLANDPHLENNMPCMWEQIELIYGDKTILGAAIPGMPMIAVGKTKYFSFGVTAVYGDTSDLYEEVLSDDGKKYLFEGEWLNVTEIEEVINVKGEDPIIHKVKYTRHGPVLDNVFDKLHIGRGGPKIGSQNYSLAWTGHIKNDNSLYGILKLLEAQTPEEIVKYVDYVVGPCNSFIYANENGDIGYIAMGKIPKRKNPESGGFVSDGTKAENDWIGLVPVSENPQIVNPKKGYIVTANNKFATDNIKHGTSINIGTSSRADRIEEMILAKISKGEKINADYMKQIQLDVMDIFARDAVGKMVALVKTHKKELLESNFKEVDDLLEILGIWNGNMTTESTAASIFTVWEYLFFLKKFQNYEMDIEVRFALLSFVNFDQFIFIHIHKWYDDPNSNLGEEWCQNPETVNHKNKACMYNLVKALSETHNYLKSKFGPDKKKWNYGSLHKVKYNHVPFSETPLKPIFHREFPAPGNRRTVNVASWYVLFHELKGIHSGNLRMVADMAPGSKSYFIIDSGVSENFMSPHYDDQQKLHQKGQYLEMKMGPKYLKDYKEILYLIPLQDKNKNNKSNKTASKTQK